MTAVRAPKRRNLHVPAMRRLGHKVKPSAKVYSRKGRRGRPTRPAVSAEHL